MTGTDFLKLNENDEKMPTGPCPLPPPLADTPLSFSSLFYFFPFSNPQIPLCLKNEEK
jgi:hypothetical protein